MPKRRLPAEVAFHFDVEAALSRQYLVPPKAFCLALAEAGDGGHVICRAKGPHVKRDVPNERKVWYPKTGTTYVNIVSPIASHGSEKHSSPIQPPKLQNPAE